MYNSRTTKANLILLIALLGACGGSSGGGESTFSDPANAEGVAVEDQIIIEVETTNRQTGRVTNSINSLEPLSILVKLKNGRDRAIAQSIVSVSSTLGQLTSSSGDILTDQQGEVTVELAVFNEQPGSAGTLTVSHLEESIEVFFTVQKAPVLIGATQDGVFSEGKINVLAPTISEGGETVLSISILDSQGNPLGRDYSATFASECSNSSPPLASIGRVEYSFTGEATAVYIAQGCTGIDVINVEIAGLIGHSAEGRVHILRPGAAAVDYTAAGSTVLGLMDSDSDTLPDHTPVFFTVTDTNGEPVANVDVVFGLSSTVGGTELEAESTATDAQGLAIAHVYSGSIPTAVRVTAQILGDAENITAISENILISSGRPDQSSFSVTADILNPGGDEDDGSTTTVSVSAADRFNSPVPDGTVIFFRTEYGGVRSSCTTQAGVCTVLWRSQDPRRPLFAAFVDDDGNPALLRTLHNTDCPGGKNSRGRPCPDFLGHPVGARSTIQAYTEGDEAFIDANANGLYDSGESFVDLPEPFLDHNEDGVFGNSTTVGSCYPDCPSSGGDEEIFIDTDGSGSYSPGNGVYNGSLCSAQAIADQTCDPAPVTVSDSIAILVSGSQPYGAFFNGSITATSPLSVITVGGVDRSLLFYASDVFNGKLPHGTTIEVSSTGCALSGQQNLSVGNSNSAGPSIFPISLTGGTTKTVLSGRIDVKVTVPGVGTARIENFSIPCTVDACSVQPAPTFCAAETG